MALKCTGLGNSYRVRLQRRISCPECRVELTAGSMTAHRCCMYSMELVIDWSWMLVSQTEHQPQVYNVRFLRSIKRCPCSFPSYPGYSHTWNDLRSHFNRHPWGYSISILEEHPNPLPRCKRCGRQVLAGRLNT